MTLVKEFDPNMVNGYLISQSKGWEKQSAEVWRTNLGHHEERGCNLDALLICSFSVAFYQVKIVSDKEIPRADWGRALLMCNTWNKDNFGQAYLSADDFDVDPIGHLVVSECVNLGRGTHQELFNHFTQSAINHGMVFWKWAHQDKGW